MRNSAKLGSFLAALAVVAVSCLGLQARAWLPSGPVPSDSGKTPIFDAPGRLGLLERISKPAKPSAGGGYSGNDTCQWANDGECDDPGLGSGACRRGTDYSDCWRIADGREDNSCEWANDGDCDEPGFGDAACTQGTDRSDCGAIGYLRFETDTCITAFDGVCDEPTNGLGTCAVRTDRSDCIGRDRPMEIRDHFFGHDDRVLVDTGQFPWSVIGRLVDPDSGTCTAALIAEDVLISAAHCIEDETGVDARVNFLTADGRAGGTLDARVISYLVSPNREADRANDEPSATDWALLRIDRPLGRELGFVEPRAVDTAAATSWTIQQAGYSWDTGNNLSGHLGCSILAVEDAHNTLVHDCDTTEGDSGSPLMQLEDGRYFVIGIDSTFRVNNNEEMNIAVRSNEWIGYLPDFAAGRIGTPVTRATKGAATP